MKAGEVMTRRVVLVAPGASIRAAARLMLKKRISGLPVVDNAGRLVGIITDGDFLRRVETGTERRRPRWFEFLLGPTPSAQEYVHSHGRKVQEVMTRNPIVITRDTPLDEVVELMERHQVKHLPVMKGRRLVGMVSRANLLHMVASSANYSHPSQKDDTTIRERIRDDLDQQPWSREAMVNVFVQDGTVDLWGEVAQRSDRKAVELLAENVAGVKSVRDHLTVTEAAVT
jgi:CBS domain-containing protein